jgi:flagellar hook assembly protein FlgD
VELEGKMKVPLEFILYQNYPNPFNPTTMISYVLAKDSHVRLTVCNTLGQVVAVLADGYQTKGKHRVTWNAHHQPSGVYFYKLKAEGFMASRKMFLQK